MRKMKIMHVLFVAVILGAIPTVSPDTAMTDRVVENECVILLHGLGRSKQSMSWAAKYLRQYGYSTVNIGYPSTALTVAEVAEKHVEPAVARCLEGGASKVHFVTHSLGGIVVRQYLRDHELPAGSKVVMLAPPNNGSEVAETLRDLWWYKWLLGPAGQCLGTGADSLPRTLPAARGEIGVIAGTRSYNPLFSMWLPGVDDGKVSVAGTKLAGMTAFLTVPASHTFIMRDTTVLVEVAHFLRTGGFSKKRGDEAAKEG